MLFRVGIMLVANAVALIVAALVLSGMGLDVTGFLVAVAIYTAIVALLQPFFVRTVRERGSAVLGVVALLATLVSLIVTDLIWDGFDIEGVGNWLAAAVIVWLVSLGTTWALTRVGPGRRARAD
jgi:uncharacterized membrane protein YvlD (DUF360 family)